MSELTAGRAADRWQRRIGWFLTVSYAIGAPAFSIAEALTGVISQRFHYPPTFLYLVGGTQFICSLVLFLRRLAPWSAAVLTVLAIGAAASHFRIGSPMTSLPALTYVALQVWYGIRVYRQNSGPLTVGPERSAVAHRGASGRRWRIGSRR